MLWEEFPIIHVWTHQRLLMVIPLPRSEVRDAVRSSPWLSLLSEKVSNSSHDVGVIAHNTVCRFRDQTEKLK